MATISIADNDARVQYTQAVTADVTQLTIDFPFFELDNINVIATTSAGVDTVLTRGTGTGTFAVNGTAVDDGFSGGNVTLGDNYANTFTFTVFRDIAVARTTDFPTSGPFNVSSLNTELDRITAIEQELETKISRTLGLSDSDASAALSLPNLNNRKGTVLAFNETSGLPEAGPSIGSVTTVASQSANINTLAGISSNITTVAGISSNVTTVAGISGNVTTVAGNTSNINAVVADEADIGTVATNISNVNTVAGISSNVTSVAGNASNINAVAADATDIGTVSSNISNVNTVAGVSSNVTTVAGQTTNMQNITDNLSAVQNAATNAATATTKAGEAATSATASASSASSASTSATAAQTAQTAAETAETNSETAETNSASSASASASSASSASTSAGTATTQAGIATTKAGEASTSASNAASSASSASSAQTAAESARDATLAAYDNFDDRYLGTKSTAPTVDNDGDALVAGALYFDSVAGAMYVYTGSAWVAAYVSGTGFLALTGGTMTGDLNFGDNDKAQFGAGNDLQIYHDGSASRIDEAGTGDLILRSSSIQLQKYTGETMAGFVADGAVTLRYDNALKLATTASGIDVTGNATFADNGKAVFGNADDLQVYHDGSNSYVKEIGTGDLILQGVANVRLQGGGNNEDMVVAAQNGAVTLYHNNSPKIATTSSGISVTGGIDFSSGILASNGSVQFVMDKDNNGGEVFLWGHNASNATTNELMRLTSAGLLGIGTPGPSQKLTVEGTANNQNSEIKLTASGVASGYLGANSDGLNIGTDSHGIVFKTGVTGGGSVGATGTERMRINSNGNVGIGASDTSLFNVAGSQAKLVVTGNTADTNIAANTDASIVISNTSTAAGNTSGLHFARADTDNTPNYAGASIVAQFPDAQVTGQYPRGELAFLTSNSANAAPTEAMRVRGDLVGIGTTAPAYKLHSQTSVGSDFAGYFYNSAASGNGTSLVARGGANNSTPNFQVQDYNGNADFTVAGNGNATFSGSVTAAGGFVGAGKVLQVVQTRTESEKSTTSTSFVASGIYVNITPSSTSSKVLVSVGFTMGASSNGPPEYKLYRGTTALSNARMSFQADANWNNTTDRGTIEVLDSPSTTSLTTYQIYFKRNGTGTAWIGRSNDKSHPNISTYVTAMEIAG